MVRASALSLFLLTQLAHADPLHVVTQIEFVRQDFWGRNLIYLSACNDDQDDVLIEIKTQAEFLGSFDRLILPKSCSSRFLTTRERVVIVELRSGSRLKSTSLSLPDNTTWGDQPWSYLLFLVVGFVISTLSEPAKNLVLYPFRLAQLRAVHAAVRRSLISNIDDPNRSLELNQKLKEVYNGNYDLFWIPLRMTKRIENLVKAFEIWKGTPVLGKEEREMILRLIESNNQR